MRESPGHRGSFSVLMQSLLVLRSAEASSHHVLGRLLQGAAVAAGASLLRTQYEFEDGWEREAVDLVLGFPR